ncbi:protoporphyrinogen oxidase [Acidicapsa acidisoli]|uniref:protoporphyrinogen oxidase n=1 Tax=Acidicapsa acidisoli TaxID=1615681 RepID=UPI0021E0B1AF|nr:protoporphyrinogen oxidase [Acidicapsa acidisoli]
MRVAIIGGGIAGLAAAYELELARRAGVDVEYELFEAGARLGGVISSTVVDGTVIEHGPDSFLTEKPAAAQLCRELGLESQFVASDDAQRKTFILVRNRLVALPDGLMFLVPTKLLATALTSLFSLPTKIRMGLELLHSPRPGNQSNGGDESVAELVRRHYGQEAVDRLADPLLSGIYGGDSTQLSARSVLPRLVEMEAKFGSLTRGMLAAMKARKEAAAKAAETENPERVSAPPPLFTTLRFGLQQMLDALVGRLDQSRLHVLTPVEAVERSGDRWVVQSASSEERFDGLIVATPAWAAAEFLAPVDRQLSDELGQIPFSSSITMNLVFDGADLDPLPEGFGFLVPAVEKRAMLACTFLHRKFPGRTAPGKSVLRAFLGGAHNAALLAESDEALAELVREELFEILRVSAIPELVEIQRWPRAMAQYSVGHQERQQRIQTRLAGLPGLRLVGNAYDGIGISDCIRLGRQAARQLTSATPQDARATAQSHT